jgi:DNA repair protein RecO (recombination protein O)
MPYERTTGLIIRTYDWSETSRIVIFYSRDLGKLRLLAKGGRRLKSNFEVSLDLISVCSIVWLRKSFQTSTTSGLEILTEARALESFPVLRLNMKALNLAYYIAELLMEGTQDYDPHPGLYDLALSCLRRLGQPGEMPQALATEWEQGYLQETGHAPVSDSCAMCGLAASDWPLGPKFYSVSNGGFICADCQTNPQCRDVVALSDEACRYWQAGSQVWPELSIPAQRMVRKLSGDSVCYYLGKKPRLLDFQ